MPAPFRRAARHRPTPAERHQRRIDAIRSLERCHPAPSHDRLRSYWHFR